MSANEPHRTHNDTDRIIDAVNAISRDYGHILDKRCKECPTAELTRQIHAMVTLLQKEFVAANTKSAVNKTTFTLNIGALWFMVLALWYVIYEKVWG